MPREGVTRLLLDEDAAEPGGMPVHATLTLAALLSRALPPAARRGAFGVALALLPLYAGVPAEEFWAWAGVCLALPAACSAPLAIPGRFSLSAPLLGVETGANGMRVPADLAVPRVPDAESFPPPLLLMGASTLGPESA